MNQNDRSKSPFSELSFSQQQEQWRISVSYTHLTLPTILRV